MQQGGGVTHVTRPPAERLALPLLPSSTRPLRRRDAAILIASDTDWALCARCTAMCFHAAKQEFINNRVVTACIHGHALQEKEPKNAHLREAPVQRHGGGGSKGRPFSQLHSELLRPPQSENKKF